MTVDELIRELARIKGEYSGGDFDVEIDLTDDIGVDRYIDITTVDASPAWKTVELS